MTYCLTPTVRNPNRKGLELSAALTALSALVVPILAFAWATLPSPDAWASSVQETLHIANDLLEIVLIAWAASKSANNSIIRVYENHPFAMKT